MVFSKHILVEHGLFISLYLDLGDRIVSAPVSSTKIEVSFFDQTIKNTGKRGFLGILLYFYCTEKVVSQSLIKAEMKTCGWV